MVDLAPALAELLDLRDHALRFLVIGLGRLQLLKHSPPLGLRFGNLHLDLSELDLRRFDRLLNARERAELGPRDRFLAVPAVRSR